MDLKRFLIASAIIWAAGFALGYVIHGGLLKPDYMLVAPLMRSEAEMNSLMGYMIAGYIFFSMAFVYIHGLASTPLA